MTTLSSLGGGVRKIAKGVTTASDSLSTGSGINTRYIDIDISSHGISDTDKCAVTFRGGAGTSATGDNSIVVFTTLSSSSTLRVHTLASATYIIGEWQIIEYY